MINRILTQNIQNVLNKNKAIILLGATLRKKME